MPMPILRPLILAAWFAAVLDHAQPSAACPVCVAMGDPFQLPHPHALRIAVATRDAIDGGVLQDVKASGSAALDAAMLRVANHQFGNRSAQPSAVAQVDVLLVDEPALYRIELRGIVARVFTLQGDRHRAADARLVTTRATIESLARGQMTIAEGIRHGLIEIEGNASVLTECNRD